MSENMLSAGQQLAAELSSLQSQANTLENDARLNSIQSEISTLDHSIGHLAQQLMDLRARGYVFEKDLEAKIEDCQKRWSNQHTLVMQQMMTQTNFLQMEMAQVNGLMTQLSASVGNPYGAQSLLAQARAALNSLQSKITAAQDSIRTIYHPFEEESQPLINHLNDIDWTLTQLAQATFQLLPSESALMAVRATYIKGAKETKEDPESVLYLTDQRLLFEQKQEIATKKVLFIATEKQKVQQLLLEAPLSPIDKVQGNKQGLFGHEDHLQISFNSGVTVNQAHFHINGQDSSAWQTLLNRAKARDFDPYRVAPVDQKEVEKVKAAPTQCPACGGILTQPVLRGMDSITCEFCGHVIRL